MELDISVDNFKEKITPVKILTKEDNKKTVSAKKKRGKSLRNILGAPTSFNFPTIEEINKNTLFESIRKVAFRKNSSDNNENKSFIKFGLNETKRSINNKKCSGVLFDTNIPKILIAHLVEKCQENKIPVLCIPGLQNFITESFGFKSISIVFTQTHLQECDAIIQQIIDNCKKYVLEEEVTKDCNKCKPEKEEPKSEIPIVYLLKSSNKKRIFVPELSVKETNKRECDVIMLDTFEKSPQRNISNFKPLIVKKIQPNVNRVMKNNKRKN